MPTFYDKLKLQISNYGLKPSVSIFIYLFIFLKSHLNSQDNLTVNAGGHQGEAAKHEFFSRFSHGQFRFHLV